MIALIVAVIASVLIADRLSNPIRRLTGAARELSEGHLETRVPAPSTSREMGELTVAFNSMAERVQASMEYISRDRDRSRDFLADVSHELKTPIAALRTFNELLRDGQVKDEATQKEFLEQSRQQIERLDWLAANLLELSKLESGLVLLDLRPDDLRAVVEDAVQQSHPAANRKGVRIVAVLPDEPIRQPHDPQRMGQVLGNLLGNAIKFTPRGGEVRVTLEPTTDGAELRVADTGVGINAAELPYVFERFYRGGTGARVTRRGIWSGPVDRALDRGDAQRTGFDQQHARQGHGSCRRFAARGSRFFTRPCSGLNRCLSLLTVPSQICRDGVRSSTCLPATPVSRTTQRNPSRPRRI